MKIRYLLHPYIAVSKLLVSIYSPRRAEGAIGEKCYICYYMGSNPDLKTRSPLQKGATTLFCFLTGRKRMIKKRYYYSTDIKRNFVPSKGIYLSKFVSCQLFILAAKSCAELLDAGFTNNGVYKILFNNSQVFDVYCDQSSRGGGNIKKKLYLIMHDRI